MQNIPAGDTTIGDPYHGYWQNDIDSLNSYFGTADDLRALSDALHAKEMYLMVDVIANDFAWPGDQNSVDYSTLVPFNESYFYHPYCQITDEDYIEDQYAVETVGTPLCETSIRLMLRDSAGLAIRTTSWST